MKRVMITGATSMLGIALTEECIKNEIEVLAFARKGSAKLSNVPHSGKVKLVERDLCDMKDAEISAEKYDCFFHLGWERTDREGRGSPAAQATNINSTLECIEFAHKCGAEAFVFAGSQAEYGRVGNVISPLTPANPENAYAAAKFGAGSLGRILCNKYGMRHVWLRIFSVYGKHDSESTMVSYAVRKMQGNEDCDFTKCEQMWDYLYSEDCAKAMLAAGKNGKNNAVYNIGSGKARPIKEFVEEIKSVLSSKSKINYGAVPYSENQVMHLCADISNLTADTGWKPETPFSEGIRKMVEKK